MTGEHVEVRVTGKQEAVDAVLRLLRAGAPEGITGGGARGPYDRRDDSGRVAFYVHLQVDVAPPPTGPPPLPPPRNLAAELVDRGDGWHVSPELATPTTMFNAGVNAAVGLLERFAESCGGREYDGMWADVIAEAGKAVRSSE